MSQNNEFSAVIDVPSNLELFAGHFPGDPLVPGAVITHWVCDELRKLNNIDIESVATIKFFQPLRPSERLNIKYSLSSDKAKFVGEVASTIICKGSLRLKASTNE